jgi:predicted MFS family arabinose efflux permease
MSAGKLKIGYFVLEGMNAFATSYYFNYLFFYLQKHLGFGSLGNLTFSALNGFLYIFAALHGGRFAQKHGYFTALNLGFAGMTAALLAGLFLPTARGQLCVLLSWTGAICFTWPTLEALVSEGENARGLPRIVGIYNIVWATCAALAFFTGGALVQTLGWQSLFWLPATVHLLQLAIIRFLTKAHRALGQDAHSLAGCAGAENPALPLQGVPPTPLARAVQSITEQVDSATAGIFVRMAWAANPLAYVAINTALPLIPDIARRLDLSPMLAGFVCSVWMFARLGAFCVLWRWTGWHYRFGWLISAYLLLIMSFAGLLLAPVLWTLVLAQLVFGWSIGLIYYSSLFYSMGASETKSVHGGVHEAAIGLGIFTGPAIGACALAFFPQHGNASTWAVTALLMVGLGLISVLRRPTI